MKDMRMPKGWTLVGTNATEYGDTEIAVDRQRRLRKLSNTTRIMEKRNAEKMEEDSDKSYKAKLTRDGQLLSAYNDKKLKSKALIKQAKALKKRKENLGAKKKAS